MAHPVRVICHLENGEAVECEVDEKVFVDSTVIRWHHNKLRVHLKVDLTDEDGERVGTSDVVDIDVLDSGR